MPIPRLLAIGLSEFCELGLVEVGKVRLLGAPVPIIYYQYTPPFGLRFAELSKRNEHTNNSFPLNLILYFLSLAL